MYPRLLQLDRLAIPTSGVFTAAGILASLLFARWAARRLDLDPEQVWDFAITGVVAALLAPRIVLIFLNWSDFHAHPLWMLGVLGVRSQPALIAGAAIAIAAMWGFAFLTRLPLRRALDALAPACALGFAISSAGEFIAGATFGTPTALPWAVTYTRRLTSLWYGTPQGTRLHPVQLYQAGLEIGIFAIFAAMLATRRRFQRDGEMMGAWLFVHGLSGFGFNFLSGSLAAADASGFLLEQSIAAALVVAGGLLWLL